MKQPSILWRETSSVGLNPEAQTCQRPCLFPSQLACRPHLMEARVADLWPSGTQGASRHSHPHIDVGMPTLKTWNGPDAPDALYSGMALSFASRWCTSATLVASALLVGSLSPWSQIAFLGGSGSCQYQATQGKPHL